ncbi:mtDNA inheritance, partitioning of the mitochondrial organelle [Mortierella hygrophila]|uniref:MtDNA inheritance, partitioning of the mitochondrial organelle n=1 Tax=Mortierella hygrophila TaxID=979708 RepID=A0A9P6F6Y5_9FUNG|nr:mtDNA inheritance, partitioning of the mitochondrial organelle [Mortierella hygrophila]
MSPEPETTAIAPPTKSAPGLEPTTAMDITPAAATTTAAPATNAPASTTTTTATPTVPSIIDREKLCPFLLKMFYKQGEHHRVDQYKPTSLPPKSSELQLYTWKNATMGEIASLVQQAIPDLLLENPGAAETGGELHFRHIYLDMTRGLYVGRDIGTVLLVDTLVPEDVVEASAGTGAAEVGDVKMDIEGEEEKGEGAGPGDGLFTKDIRKSKDSAAAAASALVTAITAAATQATATAAAGKKSTALEKTLSSIRFVIGDYLDISIVDRSAVRPGPAGAGAGREQALFTGRQGRNQGGGGGGPIRRGGDDRRRDRRRKEGRLGGGGGGGGMMADRFAGRLGLKEPLERNGHGGHGGGRRGLADSEASWKGRGRGR